MKISKTKIANLIREAMLDSRFSKLKQDIFDSIFLLNQSLPSDEYQNERRELLDKLRAHQERMNEQAEKLENPESLNSFWDYLRLLVESNKVTLESLAKGLNVNSGKLNDFLNNRTSLMNVDPINLSSLCRSFGLTLNVAKSLIEKTVKLPVISALQGGEMARYAYNGNEDNKDKSMNSGAQELLLMASKKKPLKVESQITESDDFKLFLAKFEAGYKANG